MPIRVRCLSFTYTPRTPMAVRALTDVSFDIADGELVAIVGPTGSGKSTLIQHLNGLLRPPPGAVVVDGIDVGDRRADLARLRRRVGMVFQYPEHQLFEETVFADVAFGPRSSGLPEEEVRRRVVRALRLVGLDPDEVGGRSPFTLSGGQKRRAAIAGVLALECPTLVLDEPTAGLDPRGRRELLELLRRLNRSGTTVVLVSHNMEEVAEVARRALVLAEGRLVADGPVRELFSRRADLLESLGLEVPEVVRLVRELRRRGAPVDPAVLTPEEAAQEILRWKAGPSAAFVADARAAQAGERARARRLRHRPVPAR